MPRTGGPGPGHGSQRRTYNCQFTKAAICHKTLSSQVNSIFKSIQSFSTVCMCTGVKPSDGAWVTPEELHPEENLSSPPQHLSVPNSSSARVKP